MGPMYIQDQHFMGYFLYYRKIARGHVGHCDNEVYYPKKQRNKIVLYIYCHIARGAGNSPLGAETSAEWMITGVFFL